MRERALRYLSVYVALLGLLAGVRVLTHNTYGNLQALIDREEALEYRKAQLTREVNSLESAARVRDWATRFEMIPWTTAKRLTAATKPLEEPVIQQSTTPKVKVVTQWR